MKPYKNNFVILFTVLYGAVIAFFLCVLLSIGGFYDTVSKLRTVSKMPQSRNNFNGLYLREFQSK